MADLTGGDFWKFYVRKVEDIANHLSEEDFKKFLEIDARLVESKNKEKNTDYTYIVINTDEPYADEVIEILKRNGHWG